MLRVNEIKQKEEVAQELKSEIYTLYDNGARHRRTEEINMNINRLVRIFRTDTVAKYGIILKKNDVGKL